MNKRQTSGRMRCCSIMISNTNNYQLPSSLIQPHISFHPFVHIISNRNYIIQPHNSIITAQILKLNKNYISIEYYHLNKSISIVNNVVVDTPIQWYDVVSSLLITAMSYQFGDFLEEHQILGFPNRCNFSTLIEPLNTFMPHVLDDSTYRKLSGDPEHVVQ
jgi:hypothetical protein